MWPTPHVFGNAGDDGDIAGSLPDPGPALIRTAGTVIEKNGAPLKFFPRRHPHFMGWEVRG